MADLLARTGVTTMVVNETNSSVFKIYSTTNDPEIILWNMFQRSTFITGKTVQGKTSYQIGEPYQVSPENDKLFRVELTNLSDPKFKIGSVTTIDFLKHDIVVLENTQLQPAPLLTFEALLADLVNRNKVKFTAGDFDLENCFLEDGLWSIKASNNSFFFTAGSIAKLWNRGSWNKIVDFLPSSDLGQFTVSDKAKTTLDIFDDNLVRINNATGVKKPIPLSKLKVTNVGKTSTGVAYLTLDRRDGEEIQGPVNYNYQKVKLASLVDPSYVVGNTSYADLNMLEDGTVYSNLHHLNTFFGTSLTPDDLVDGEIKANMSKNFKLIASNNNLLLDDGSEFEIIRAPFMDKIFLNTSLNGFEGEGVSGPGGQYVKGQYDYVDGSGRSTKYMGTVTGDRLFTHAELMSELVGEEPIDYIVPYPDDNLWFKYELDGEIVYVPKRTTAINLSYNHLKQLNLVNRSGDHIDGVNVLAVGNYKAGVKSGYRSASVIKDGRVYAVSLIRGLNADGPMLPYVVNDTDSPWVHDSEWNRLYYPITELTTVMPNGNLIDKQTSQKGPDWDSFTAIEMSMANDGTDGRYTIVPEQTIEAGIVKAIYRGCYGSSARGRVTPDLNTVNPVFGIRPLLKLLKPLTVKYNLKAGLDQLGNYVEFEDGSDFDYCRKVSIAYRKVGATAWSSAKPNSDTTHTFLIDSSFSGAEIYFKHTDGLHWYSTNVLTLGELSDIRLIYRMDTSENKTYPSLAGRIDSQNNDVKTYNSATPGWFDMWGGGLLNVRLGGFSANWGNGGNTTRYVSGHVCRIIDGVFETRISGRYFSNNGNSKTGLNNSEMQFVISLNGLVRGETPLRISLDYLPTGAVPNATSIYDSGTSKSTKFYEFPERGTRCQLVFDIVGATCQLSINGVVVKTGPLKNEISIGTHYHVVPSTIYVADPLYGIGIENLTIMYLG